MNTGTTATVTARMRNDLQSEMSTQASTITGATPATIAVGR